MSYLSYIAIAQSRLGQKQWKNTFKMAMVWINSNEQNVWLKNHHSYVCFFENVQGAVLKGQECQKNFIPDTKTNPLALREMLTSKHGMVVSILILGLRVRFKVKFFLFKRFLKNNVKQLVLRACEKLSCFPISFKVGGKF